MDSKISALDLVGSIDGDNAVPIVEDLTGTPLNKRMPVRDEDDMASNDAKALSTQQAIRQFGLNLIAQIGFTTSATGDGITDDTTQLQADITAAAGGTIFIPKGNYKVTGSITVSANTTIIGYGARIFDTATHRTLVILSARCKVFGLEVEGAGNSSYDANGKGISITGTEGSEVQYVTIQDCYVHGLGNYGIVCDYAWHVNIYNTHVEDIGYAGVMVLSSQDVNFDHGHIKDITPGDSLNCYGIAFTKLNDAAYELSRDCSITNSIVENVSIWEGIDTHGGHAIRIENNIVKGCSVGIVLKMAPSSGTAQVAATDCIVRGNIVYGLDDVGCYINGTADVIAKNNIVSDNIFIECGVEGGDSVDTGALYLGYTENTVVSNNVFRDCYASAIILRRVNNGFTITGNIIMDVQNTVVNQTTGIFVYLSSVGLISGNQILRNNASLNTYVGELGIYVGGDAGNSITLGQNQNNFTTKFSGDDGKVNGGFLTYPRARAYLGSNQLNLVNATPTQVTLGSEDYDIGANFASSAFTAPRAGYYRIRGSVTFASVIATKLYVGHIYKGAASIADDYKHSSLAQSLAATPEATVLLAVGDVITLYASSYSGDNTVDIIAGSKYTYLEVEFIGD